LPLSIEQLTDEVVPPVISYTLPSGALRWITPPEWPSITLAVQLEKAGSKAAFALAGGGIAAHGAATIGCPKAHEQAASYRRISLPPRCDVALPNPEPACHKR